MFLMAHFQIPLDLPHAGRLAGRIVSLLQRRSDELGDDCEAAIATAEELGDLLWPYTADGENPNEPKATRIRDEAAVLGRRLVDEIEALGVGSDRVGQCVRNIFECLELGEEGAAISLRAGENPDSLQRPI